MSHPDPLFDDENHYEDDEMAYNYDDHDDFYENDETADEAWADNYDDSMDGDHESGLASCGWGTDEDYGYYGNDREDFHADESVGFVDYYEDGPYDD